LLGNDSVNTFPRQRIRKQQLSNFRWYTTALYFLRGPCKVIIKKISVEESRVELRDASLPGYELGIELSWQLQNNGKKGIRL
jgi:hypothetical protein